MILDLAIFIFVTPYIGNEADLTLETAEPLDLETDGPSFRVDILAESRDTGLLEPRIARVVVKVKNVEDEEPAFFLESLVNTIYRNADLRWGEILNLLKCFDHPFL